MNERVLHEAARIKGFLTDEIVAKHLGLLERKYYEEFLRADTSEKRVRAWAQATVLREFTQELQAVVGAGEHEQAAGKKTGALAPRT